MPIRRFHRSKEGIVEVLFRLPAAPVESDLVHAISVRVASPCKRLVQTRLATFIHPARRRAREGFICPESVFLQHMIGNQRRFFEMGKH